MTDALKIGLSALLAQQRALSVTSNNIANASTPGYSRQRIELTARPTETQGGQFVGTGVDGGTIRRLSDELLAVQVRSAAAGHGQSDVLATLASGIDSVLADSRIGLSASLQELANAAQDLADDPASSAARRVLLSQARQTASTFQSYDTRLDDIARQANERIDAAVTEINSIGRNIADLNKQIIGLSDGGQTPSDLLDQRDRLLGRLAELVRVETAMQPDGAVSVFIGNGQALVLGGAAAELATVPGEYNVAQTEIALRTSGTDTIVTSALSGGELGGALDFRRELLGPVRNELGRIATGLAATLNELHHEGLDADGELGGDLFAVGAPAAFASRNNAGSGTLSVSIDDVAALEPSAYRLSFDGTAYALERADNGAAVPMTGTGTPADPLTGGGLAIVVGGAPAAGDRFLLEPLAEAPGSLRALVTDPAKVAAAAPIRTRADISNQGDASISAGEVADVADPDLLTTTTITFLTPTTYSIDGAGSFTYTSGQDIVVNGARVAISGTPAAGDTFLVEPNFGGAGDNRNALRLGAALGDPVLAGGTSLEQSAAELVVRVGTQTQEAMYRRDAQKSMLDNAAASLDGVRGVNLDEEAARLLEQQQLYQAAAQTISVAGSLFQTLLGALRG